MRAGRGGRVYTLLRHEDVKHFKGMLRKVGPAVLCRAVLCCALSLGH